MANPTFGVELELIYKRYEAGLKAAGKATNDFEKQIDKVAETTAKSNAKMAASMDKSAKSIISFRDVIGALGLYQLTSQFTQFFATAYQGAATFEALALGNKALAVSIGTTTEALAKGTQAAALGMIDDAEAIRQANEAIMTGAVGSQAEMEEMTRIAVSLGIAMGKTAAEAIDIFTTALGKGQPRLLYQLGITLDVDKAEQAYAATLGKTAAALTDLEKKEAVRTAALTRGREVMESMGDISGLQAVKMQQLTTSWDEFGDSMGNLVIEAENATGLLGFFKFIADEATKGAEAWGYVVKVAVPAIQEFGRAQAEAADNANALIVKNAQLTGSYSDLIIVLGGLGLADQKRLLLENVNTFEEWVRIVNEMTMAGYDSADMLREMTQEQFSLDKATALSAKALDTTTTAIKEQIIGWDQMGGALRSAADAQARMAGVSLFGIQLSNWYTEALEKEAAGWQFLDAQTKAAAATEAAAQKVRQEGWIKSTSSLASFILAAQDAKAGLTGGGTGGADTEKTANDARVQNKTDLNTKLAQLDQERSDKIAWVHSGDWARTAEQNAADLQFWNDHYDKLQSETILGYMGRNVEIQKAEDAAKAIAAKAAAEEKAAFEARMLDLRTSAALTIMETQGTLTQFTGGMATTAADALEKMKAGVIAITPEMASTLAGTLAGVNADMAAATANQVTNLAMLKDAQDGVINNSTTLAGITSDAVDQVTIPPEKVAQIDAVTVALNGAMTMFDTLAAKAAENQDTFFKSIKGMSDAVDEVDWEEEVSKPIVQGIAEGLLNNTEITNEAMRGLVMQMLAAATSAAGAQSPATEFMPLGVDIAEGILAGMDSTGSQINSTAQDLMHELMKNFVGGRGFGSDMRRRVLEQFDAIMADVTVGTAETYQQLFERIIPQLVGDMGGAIGQMVQRDLPQLWAMLGETAAQTVVTATERAAGLFKAAGMFGSFGTTAAGLQRSQSTARITALQDQLMLMDDQTSALAEQERILGEIEKERAKMAALEATQLRLQEQQAQLQFLQQQAALLDMLSTYNLNPAAILGGLKLGLGADFSAVAEAMSRAMEAILAQADAALGFQHGGAFTVPSGYPDDRFRVGVSSGERVVITPQGFAPAGGVTVTFGNVAINNGMDLAVFKSVVLQTVREASRG